MRVSSKAHYGLRMMTEFAKAYGTGPLSIAEVARIEHLPARAAVGGPPQRPPSVLGEARERVAEAIALIKLAWTQERVHFQGKYWQADNLPVLPQPVQQPHPPLLLAANSNDTFPYAAHLGLGAVCTTLSQPMPRLIDRLAEYAAAKPAHGMTLQDLAS